MKKVVCTSIIDFWDGIKSDKAEEESGVQCEFPSPTLPPKKGGGKCHLHWSKLVLGQQQQPLQNVTNIGMWHCGHQS